MTEQTLKLTTTAELHVILQWWITHMTDHENGGFYGRINGNGHLYPAAEKGVILNTRILWTFSAAARKTGNATYRAMATRAYDYLTRHFTDPMNGGVYWSLDYTGAPLQTKKQVYTQAFAIYALSEYTLLTGDSYSLNSALGIVELLERYTFDCEKNGYFEAYSEEWQLLEDLRLSDKDANEAKTQNTHLHLLEAYANLLRALQNDPDNATAAAWVSERLENLVGLFTQKFIDPETAHIHLFFDENWHLKSDIVSFGHDIEASWLLWDAVQTIGNEVLIGQVKSICLHIAEVTLKEAVDPDGAVINQRWNSDGRLDTDRIWWVQAEAIVGFWNAFRMSGDERYQKAAIDCWNFTHRNMRDTAGGEWYWRISRTGELFPEEDKAGFWKCPYHNGRAMMCFLD
jgi:mannobiose 2-epimerase